MKLTTYLRAYEMAEHRLYIVSSWEEEVKALIRYYRIHNGLVRRMTLAELNARKYKELYEMERNRRDLL